MKLQRDNRIAIDDHGLILEEYGRNVSRSGQPGLGDYFFKWVNDNQGNAHFCEVVPVTPLANSTPEFSEFPSDPDLEKFDPSDRKFVAVALSGGANRPILNAVDSDWAGFREALGRNGVFVRELCASSTPGKGRPPRQRRSRPSD
ncbi:MAG: hypothetical protein SFX72_07615 [Isosphaeraceae bacterium]|nr:hypothetical protein [Isosphaeraceae bacterium]